MLGYTSYSRFVFFFFFPYHHNYVFYLFSFNIVIFYPIRLIFKQFKLKKKKKNVSWMHRKLSWFKLMKKIFKKFLIYLASKQVNTYRYLLKEILYWLILWYNFYLYQYLLSIKLSLLRIFKYLYLGFKELILVINIIFDNIRLIK